MVSFRFMPINFNYSSRKGKRIQYLVIHDTGNSGSGANAFNHYKFFAGGNRNASAHYFVDDHEIVQIIGDGFSAWHCGDTQGYGRALNGVRNCTSIGIELCINSDGDYQKAYENLVELVKNLMSKFNVSIGSVCRHYDVSKPN
ncbi:N-acetylmuramoyl-L-alanine amidase [Peptoniphilus sp. GNH]|nr:N-acetylmuramoyl-L-alanine amidase [Peptoniphilus sp. GNH]